MVHDASLDLRKLPVWERAELVLSHCDDLESGGSFDFLTEVDPRALISRMEQLRPKALDFRPLRVGDEQWRISVQRIGENAHISGIEAAFARNPFLLAFGEESRDAIRYAARIAEARKGHTVAHDDREREFLGVLLEGTLGIFEGGVERERMLYQIYPYELFGDVELIDGGLAVGRTAVLSRSAQYLQIPYAVVRDELARTPQAWRALALSSAQHTRTLAGELAAQVQQPILARVAAALLPYAAPERAMHPALAPLPTMTQTQIAAAAGTVKEVAARAIAELERLEAIRREHGHIAFLNRPRLLEIIDRY